MSAAFRRGMAGIVALAIALRIAIYQGFQRGRPYGFNDAEYYGRQASALVRGHWFVDPATGAPGAEHGPLTTVLVAPLSWMDHPENWQRLATIGTGVLSVVVIGLIGHTLGQRSGRATTTGLVAATLAAVYPNLWLNDGVVMSESLCTLLVSLWILLSLRMLVADGGGEPVDEADVAPRRTWSFARLGIVCGLGVLARSELILLPLITAVLIWRSRHPDTARSITTVLVATAVVVAPWVVPNLVRFENPVVLSTNDGTTFRGANCDRTYHGREIGSWSVFCLVIDPDTVGMETSERSARWRADGLGYAADHAGRIPLVLAARVGRTLDLFGLDYQMDEDVRDGRPRLGSLIGVVSFWLLAPLAIWGVRRRHGLERWILVAPVLVVAVSTLAFYGGHRIRSPLEPVVVVGAALTIASVAAGFLRGRSSDAH